MNLMNSAGLNYELLIIMRERIYEQKQRVDVECPVYYNISGSANELICEDGHLITENGKNNNKKTTRFLCTLLSAPDINSKYGLASAAVNIQLHVT